MYKVVIAEPVAQEGIDLLEAASGVTYVQPEPGALRDAIRDAQALIIRGSTVVDRALVDAAPDLKVVARAGLGLENVDIWTATERGVMVMNVPGAYAVSAAEHTLGLILTLARHIPTATAALHRGEWQHLELIGMELHGKTLGIIGLGGVGRKVAQLAGAFGMTVLSNDPYVPDEVARQQQVIMADLDELLARSDFVSVHVPATPDTEQLIGAEQIAKMKPDAYLINMAWSKAVDQDALCEALQSSQLAGAALDVFAVEPPVNDRLCDLPNVVLTPHLGDRTHEAQREIAIRLAQQVIDALRGTDFRNVVNLPFISGASYERLKGYLQAAERIGALQVEMADGPIQHLQIECIGESLWDQVRPITVALLKGTLERMVDGEVNYINAPVIAHKHDLEVSQARGLGPV